MTSNDLTILEVGAADLGLSLSASQLDQFNRYLEILLEWNQRLSLTAVKDPASIQRRHFLDSLNCITVTGELNGKRLADVGSGAGFPGLPLKIVYPDMRLTLVESVTKKAKFLEAAAEELALDGLTIAIERAEELGQQSEYREQYDWAVARAVAKLPVLVEYLLPLCKVEGHALAQKGVRGREDADAAANAIKILGGGRPRLHPVSGSERELTGYLVVIQKIASTPKKYPRRIGSPAKRPL